MRMMLFFLGLLMVFAAVGTLDVDPDTELMLPALIALGGLLQMWLCRPQLDQ